MDATAKDPAKRRLGVMWVVILVLLLLVVGIVVGWDMISSNLERQAQPGEAGGDPAELPPLPGSRKSREVVVGQEGQQPGATTAGEDDDLSPLGKRKQPAVKPAGVPSNLPPGERAWRTLKADYDRLDGRNGSAARKYNLKVQALGNQRSALSEAQFILQAQALDEKLKDELARPENR